MLRKESHSRRYGGPRRRDVPAVAAGVRLWVHPLKAISTIWVLKHRVLLILGSEVPFFCGRMELEDLSVDKVSNLLHRELTTLKLEGHTAHRVCAGLPIRVRKAAEVGVLEGFHGRGAVGRVKGQHPFEKA